MDRSRSRRTRFVNAPDDTKASAPRRYASSMGLHSRLSRNPYPTQCQRAFAANWPIVQAEFRRFYPIYAEFTLGVPSVAIRELDGSQIGLHYLSSIQTTLYVAMRV